MRERQYRQQHSRCGRGQWPAQSRQRRGKRARQPDGAAGAGVGPNRWGDAAKYGDGRDSTGEGGRSGACQCVWAAAGEADDAEPVGTEGVHHVGHVGGPVGHLLVGVRVGQARSRSLHQHDAQAELLSSAAPDERELTPATRRAVEPENDRPGRVAELGVAQPPTAGEEEAPFRARLFAAGDAGRVPPGVGRAHNLGSSWPVRGNGDPLTA
jgi:hypothetical protein